MAIAQPQMKSVFWGYGEIPIKRQAEDFAILRLLSFGSKRPCLPNLL